jgi:hypothetical protein
MLALALTAFVGVASASASGTAFTSEASETAYSGYGTNLALSAAGRTTECSSELLPTSILKGPQENLSLVNEANCTDFGKSHEMKMNSCKLEFQPGAEVNWEGTFAGTYSIGPAGCGPVTMEFTTPACQLSIPAQTGLAAVYRDVGNGSSAKVEVEPTAQNLKYSGCGVNNGENGSLSGTWTLSGKNPAGTLVGIAVKTLPHSPLFEAEAYPITYNGSQDQNHVLVIDGSSASCTSATFADTESGTTKALSLSASYAGCTAFGFLNSTISPNGCHFVQEVSESTGVGKYSGPGSLTCPSGASLEIVTGVCTVAIPAQSMGTLSYEDAIESGVYKVKSSTAAKGLTFTVTRDAFGCPLEGTGTRTNGEYRGKTTFTGKNGSGETRKIRIGG